MLFLSSAAREAGDATTHNTSGAALWQWFFDHKAGAFLEENGGSGGSMNKQSMAKLRFIGYNLHHT
jgi:hypothetical protein